MVDQFIDRIIHGDAIEVMRHMPTASIPLIATSPPYNLLNTTGCRFKNSFKWKNAALRNGYQDYSDDMPYPDYVAWQRECLTEMMRLIPEHGAIFYNHKWRVQNGLMQDRYDIVRGFPVRQIVIWKRKGGFNFNPGYFLPTFEVIYLIAKPKFKLAKKANTLTDVWEITQERNNSHPAPFPEALTDRIISSTHADIVLDPFIGSGTTAVSAIKHGRNFIGIEKSELYCKMAEKRIERALLTSGD
jgi:modification methylase